MDINLLVKLMDKEIALYKILHQLYSEKKDSLMENNISSLKQIDNKILEISKLIKILQTKRLEVSGGDYFSLSSLILYAQSNAPEYISKLESQKLCIKQLIKNISDINRTNHELIQHGLLISEKTLNLFIRMFVSNKCNYSSSGHNVEYTFYSAINQSA